MKNVGYLQSSHTPESDNVFTPEYVVYAIAKYIPINKNTIGNIQIQTKILCPFDKDEHAFPTVFKKLGFNVINTHYNPATQEGKDFFTYTKEELDALGVDYIISNPPFSLKDDILEYCETLGINYALLLPLPTAQGNRRFKKVFSKGNTQLLIFDKRIPYSTTDKHYSEMSGNHFASIFFCKGVLPKDLIFDELKVR